MLYNSNRDSNDYSNTKPIPSGLISLDLATGHVGIPRGKIIELFGEVDSGKSALSLHLVSAVQKSGTGAAYIDLEGKIDTVFAAKLGVEIDKTIFCSPYNAEDTFDACEIFALGGEIGIVVIDSITALLPKSECENETDKEGIEMISSTHLEVISRGMRRLESVAKKTGCIFVLISQLRGDFEKITASDEKSTGGISVMTRAEIRIQLFRSADIQNNGEYVGLNIRACVLKNRASMKAINIWLVLYFCSGFSIIEGEILNALNLGVLQKKDGELYYRDVLLGGDRQEVCNYINSNFKMFDSITQEIRAKYLR